MNDIERLKESIKNRLKANEGKTSPNSLDIGMMSNSLNVKAPEFNPFSIVSKDVIINGKTPDLPKDVLAPSNVHDEKARNEWMAELKLKDPTKYKQEFAKQQYLDYQKELVKNYSLAEAERNKRRSK